MAKSDGKRTTRQKIKVQTMRELMFASGGRCAMTNCGLSLTSPSGGWIGTVAHIVGAESDGPRGAGSLTPVERASFDNLMLMCATHGREVDAPDTGEAKFPIDLLLAMKRKHEAKVTQAVNVAITQDQSGVRTGTGAIDTALRPASVSATAAGLLESLCEPDSATAGLVSGLEAARGDLQLLSQLALDTLSSLLALWVQECRHVFGDPSVKGPSLAYCSVQNRVKRGGGFGAGMEELSRRSLIGSVVDEYGGSADYVFESPWELGTGGAYGWNFWISAACFLHEGYNIDIHDWVRTLDFSIFDRVAPLDRDVSWR